MKPPFLRVALLTLGLGFCVLIGREARATATANSQLSFSGLSITPSAGSLVILSNWDGAAFAQAGSDSRYNAAPTVGADVTSTYSVAHGDVTSSPFSLTLSGSGSSSAGIFGQTEASDTAAGRGSLSTSFMITGGSGPVNVLFSADLIGSLGVFTDSYGESAEAETIFALEIDGNPLLFDQHFFLIGPSDSQNQSISQTLSDSIQLQFGVTYQLWLEADGEVAVSNVPEPGLASVALCGLAIFAFCNGRIKRRKMGARSRMVTAAMVSAICVFAPAGVQAMYIGSDPPNPCAICACRCTRQPGGDIEMSLSEGNLRDDFPAASIRSDAGPTVDFGMVYNSYNADGSKARVDTGMGLGWTHSYNIFIFLQRGHLFRMDADGRVTQYYPKGGGKFASDTGYFETLTMLGGGGYIITNKAQSWWQFAAVPNTPFLVEGPVYRLIQMGDRNQNVTSLSYSNGLLVLITDTYGRSLSLGYTNQNKLATVTDPLGRTTRFQYDAQYRTLTRITDPAGNVIRYTYNPMFQMTRKIDRDGNTYMYLYKQQRPFAVVDSLGQSWFSLANSTNWGVDRYTLAMALRRQYYPGTTTRTNGLGNTWTYSYDTNGYLTKIVEPGGATTTYSYDPATRYISATTNANGAVTRFYYDAQGNRTNITDTLGEVTSYTYDPTFNQVTSQTDANGRVTTYQYDSRGNRTNEIDPLLQSQSWTYDSHGNMLSATDRRGNVTTYQYDSYGNRTNMMDALGQTTRYTYDGVGNRVTMTDPLGRTTTYTYDSLNRMTGTTNALGGVSSFGYDGMGRRTSVTDPNTNLTTYGYDNRGRLIQTIDPLGNGTTYGYDTGNNRIASTNQSGQVTTYTYDSADRLIRSTNALGGVVASTYDGVGNTIAQTDPNGHTTTYTYDGLNRRTTVTDPLGGVTSYDYAMPGGPPCCSPTFGSALITRVEDPLGKVTFYKYDELDRLTKTIRKNGPTNDVITPNDAVMTYTYDPVGNRLSITDPVTNVTSYSYDPVNRMVASTNGAGDVTQFAYDPAGNRITRTDPNGNVTTSYYDSLNRVIASSDEISLISSNQYDAVGNQIRSTDANGNVTAYTYDGLNRLTSATDALGQTATMTYDPVGNLITTTDRNGNAAAYGYDSLNRRVSGTNALGNVTRYAYDGVGNLTNLTDANGHTTTFMYDSNNRGIVEIYPDAPPNSRTNFYDASGHITSRRDQSGHVITYSYNDFYLVTNRLNQPSGVNDRFVYDVAGRVTSGERNGWVDTFIYDGANRLTNSTQNGRVMRYTYDIEGRVQTNTYPSGRTLNYSYDARNRLTTLNDGTPNPAITTYTYDGANRVVTRSYRNGTVETYSYNSNNWVTGLEHTLGLTRIVGFGYEYDAEGNKLCEEKRHLPADSEAYAYDATYRLTNCAVGTLACPIVPSPAEVKTWFLDPVGNWDMLISNSVPELRAYGPANELTNLNGNLFTYDADGNLQQDTLHTYGYDEANRLIQVTRLADSAIVGQYFYDAFGRRIAKIANPAGVASTNLYFYDVGRIIEDQDGAGATVATYTYGNYIDEVLTMDRGGQSYYYHQNTLWSPYALTDGTGVVVERYTYDVYGQVVVLDPSYTPLALNAWGTPHSVVGNPWLYTGRELDEETGLYFYRSRYYDAGKGRFLERDTRDYDDGPNLYMYVQDRPTRFVDPTGTASQQCTIRGWKPAQGGETRFPFKDKKSFRRGFGPVLLNFGYDVDLQGSDCESCCGDGRKFTDQKMTASISFKAELSVASYAGFFSLGGVDWNFWLGAKGTLGTSASASATLQSDKCKGVNLEGEVCGNLNIYGSLALGGEASVDVYKWWSANVGVTGTATLNFPGKACFRCRWFECEFDKFEWQRPRIDFTVSGCIATLGCVSFSPPSIEF